MDNETQREIREDFKAIDLPGLIHHPDGRKNFQPVWTEEQEQEARRLYRKGVSASVIGERIGKNPKAVAAKLSRMGAR